MKFLNIFQNTNLTPLKLLDLAFIIVLLPLFLMLKVPMLVFVVMVLGIVFFTKKPAKTWLIILIFVLGIFALYLSLYGAFSFRGLSRLKLFLELLVYVLLIVVSMQRLTQQINIYLLLSPFLFLALSLFFFHGMLMLIYVIFEIFFLLWMILSHRMEGDIVESFRSSIVMFMYSLPWVVVLFIFFPRISFEHASYGFRGETVQRMGHDGTMFLDNKALLVPSDRIVMEVGFEKKVPPSNLLYFRGSILYIDNKDHWEPIPSFVKRKKQVLRKINVDTIEYKVTLYPTQKRWIYLLDVPVKPVKESKLDRDLISTVKHSIKEPMHYAATSALSSRFYDELDRYTLKVSSRVNPKHNPQTYAEAMKIKDLYPSIEKRAKEIIKFFKSKSLTYTLKPEPLDINHTTDSFLFDKRRGYCVHFASSFVTMARMTGIPSRIVTGYKGDVSNALNNYLAVKEKNAHAWAELYINQHWVRYETTSTASHIESQQQTDEDGESVKSTKNPLVKKVNLYLMYAKYQVETWILYYSNIRQKQLLQYAKDNPKFIFTFVVSLIFLVMISFLLISYFRRPTYSSEALAILQPLLQFLKKKGFVRKKSESLHQYFMHYVEENQEKIELTMIIKEIDKIYELIVYGNMNTKELLKGLKKLVKKFKKI
ncbi:MAG: hypothetical protein COA92_06150 [Sulfurovum sp.]|nr:MAG: hypothetical protein COA92_06150 [Sulfurovum sp.]